MLQHLLARRSSNTLLLRAAGALAAMAMLGGIPPAFAQAYPTKPVRLVVPYPPGGSVDPVARMMAEKLGVLWGQSVLVDNKPGASTIIGTDAVAKAPADGYTLLLTASTHVSNSLLFNTLPYDAVKDFAPVGTLYKAEFVLVANPSVPAANLQELIALAKRQPGQLSYASAGPGNANHMAGELFNMMTGTKMLHVPYKGGGPLLTDLLSNQVQLWFAVPVAVISNVQGGKLKALATTAESRLSLMPGVPTIAEAGLPGFGMKSWIGIWAPAKTPKAVVDKASADIARVLAMPDVRQKLESQGQIPFTSTPEQMAALVKSDEAEFANIIKTANVKIDQ